MGYMGLPSVVNPQMFLVAPSINGIASDWPLARPPAGTCREKSGRALPRRSEAFSAGPSSGRAHQIS
jgi:hypothetical protein